MVRAWYYNDDGTDQRAEHQMDPPQFINLVTLHKLTGVEYFKIKDVKNPNEDLHLLCIKEERGYTFEDEITCSRDTLENYEEKIKMFFEEHLHTDEEIRLVLAGSGFFDVRDKDDRWIRIEVETGDLLIIPAGIYHRFTLDTNEFIRAKRYFVGEPVWTAHNRPADHMDVRKKYMTKLIHVISEPSAAEPAKEESEVDLLD